MTGALSPLSILKHLWGLCCILWGGQSVGACDRALGCTGIRLLLMHPRCSIPCSTSFRWPNKLSEAARELAHPLAMSHQIDPHPDPLRLCVCSQDYGAIEVSEQSTSSEPPSLALLGLSLRVCRPAPPLAACSLSPLSGSLVPQLVVAYLDPCHLASHPGWPLRNLLALAVARWAVPSLAVLALKETRGRPDWDRSLAATVHLPDLPGQHAPTGASRKPLLPTGSLQGTDPAMQRDPSLGHG
jgi:hypothetical protein